MHDLELFFWVLFWICIHYNGPDKDRVVLQFENIAGRGCAEDGHVRALIALDVTEQ